MTRFLSIAAAIAVLGAGSAQAQPAQDGDTYKVTIRTADLDLAGQAGQSALRARIGRAADTACGVAPVLPLDQAAAIAECRVLLARSALAHVEVAQRSVQTGTAGTR